MLENVLLKCPNFLFAGKWASKGNILWTGYSNLKYTLWPPPPRGWGWGLQVQAYVLTFAGWIWSSMPNFSPGGQTVWPPIPDEYARAHTHRQSTTFIV